MGQGIRGVLFDKDGTLFDFAATWNAWAEALLDGLAGGDRARAARLGSLIGFDLAARAFDPASEAIAGTPRDIVRLLAPGMPGAAPGALLERIERSAEGIVPVEAAPLGEVLGELRAAGLKLGVATNDAEAVALAQLASAGQAGAFDFVAGYDSGHGGKPDPGMCLAFAGALGIPAEACVMVGDSLHDLAAGRAAGMRAVAVLTGVAGADDLAPFADAVLPDIGGLAGWIRREGGPG